MLFGPGEVGETPILAPQKEHRLGHYDRCPGFCHQLTHAEKLVPREKTEAIVRLLGDCFPPSRHQANARGVLSMAGEVWDYTYVVRAGRRKVFVWRLLRLTGLHDERDPPNRKLVRFGRAFHANLLFWKSVIDHKLLQAMETISAPCYTVLKRPAKGHHLSDIRRGRWILRGRKMFTGDTTCPPN